MRGSSIILKRGTKVKCIRLTDNHEEVDCKIDGTSLVLKTCFLKNGYLVNIHLVETPILLFLNKQLT